MNKYANDYASESDIELIDEQDDDDVEDSGSELDNRYIDYKKKKRKKEMKKASKFIDKEAELSR